MKKNQDKNGESTANLKGTFIAVMILGIFILVSWFIVFGIYLSR